MAHGQPDYGMYSAAQTIYGLADMGELAVRLGSPVVHDRRGDVLWFDTFENGIGSWSPQPSGYQGSVTWDGDYSRKGGFSMKLATSGAAEDVIEAWHLEHFPVLSPFGFEASFQTHVSMSTIDFAMTVETIPDYFYPVIRYDYANHKLQYKDSEGEYQDIATDLSLKDSVYVFHVMKLVFDPTTGKYVRLIVNATEYDLSGIAAQNLGTGDEYIYQVGISLTARLAVVVISRIDYAILTQNEP